MLLLVLFARGALDGFTGAVNRQGRVVQSRYVIYEKNGRSTGCTIDGGSHEKELTVTLVTGSVAPHGPSTLFLDKRYNLSGNAWKRFKIE